MKNTMLSVALLLMLGGSQALAGPMTFASGAGEDWTSTVVAPFAGDAVEIGVHGAWQANNPDGTTAKWISYDETGVDGNVLAPTSQATPLMSFTYNLSNATVGSAINLKVWADDTAGIYFNNVQVKAPEFGQDTCANLPIGCQPFESASFNWIAGASNVIRIDVYQVGTGTTNASNPFGVLYYGSYSTPDGGATLTLLGGALIGLSALRRKIRR